MNDDRRNSIRTALALIKQAGSIIEDAYLEEESAYDSLPENLRGSPQGQQAEYAVKALELATEAVEELKSQLEDACAAGASAQP